MNSFNRLYENQNKSLNRNLLIVDMNNSIHKAIYIHPNLYCEYKGNNVYTGGIYGFIQQTKTAIEKFNIDDMIICTDHPPYMRNLLLKEYKAKRKKPNLEFKKKFHDTVIFIHNFATRANIALWSKCGFEADDLIYMLCSHYHKEYNKIFILSNDKDLYQAFTFINVFLIKSDVAYGNQHFLEDYKISVDNWVWVAVLSGGHNGIPGLEGIGEKTAIKMAEEMSSSWATKGFPALSNQNRETELLKIIHGNYDKIKFYYHLAKLPFFYGAIQCEFKTPKIKKATKESIEKANIFLRKLKFDI